jgi:hypothetical protein
VNTVHQSFINIRLVSVNLIIGLKYEIKFKFKVRFFNHLNLSPKIGDPVYPNLPM